MHWLPESFVRGDGSVRRDWLAYTLALLLVDAASIATALAVAGRLRPNGVSAGEYMVAIGVLVPCWLATMFGFGLYQRTRLLSGTDEYAGVLQATAGLTVVLVLGDMLLGAGLVSRGWLLAFPPALVVVNGVFRMCARRVVYATRRRGAFRPRAIIAGVDDRSVQLAQHLTASGFQVLGFFDDFRPAGSRIGPGEWPVLCTTSQLSRAGALGADEVIVNPVAIPWDSRRAILGAQSAWRFDVRMLADREEALTGHIRVASRAGVPLYELHEVRIAGLEAAIKRGFDLAAACGLVLILGPFALARVLSRVAARQAVLDRHELLGAGGRPVRVYTLAGPGHRVISKLPAVAAVLRGDMSIVGPGGIEGSNEQVPAELRMMKPGLTSPVSAGREGFDEASAAAVQLEYVRNYSVWRDLQVLWHRFLALRQSRRDAVNSAAFWELRPYTPGVEQES